MIHCHADSKLCPNVDTVFIQLLKGVDVVFLFLFLFISNTTQSNNIAYMLFIIM